MNNLLTEIAALLYTDLVTTKGYLTTVMVMDDFTAEVSLKAQHLPTLIVMPVSETHEPGPFGDTARQRLRITLRVVARSADPLAYQTNAVSGTPENTNVFNMTKEVRRVLYDNKKLTSNTFEMTPEFTVTDLKVLWNRQSGHFSARDISLEYTQLEYYTGMQNEQSSLDTAALDLS